MFYQQYCECVQCWISFCNRRNSMFHFPYRIIKFCQWNPALENGIRSRLNGLVIAHEIVSNEASDEWKRNQLEVITRRVNVKWKWCDSISNRYSYHKFYIWNLGLQNVTFRPTVICWLSSFSSIYGCLVSNVGVKMRKNICIFVSNTDLIAICTGQRH